ncbi:thyroid transcription factor 1-associated protein 26-like [Argiope bruennichi]|uniref:Thyroid transcription factor 1-associated protein 26 n=1 Tax=Argiope bruennichi TaxID=94029 RepID=A0A8T0F871_ARGBR|nr:thyroid transcription factor 1-associated protein 26-like [Argiope bruennichi]KAF8786415.1 hypothetical protein HNY73_008135 [Argiope bruennichi]
MGKPKKEVKNVAWDRKKNAILREYRKMHKGKKGISLNPNHNQGNTNDNKTFFKRAMHEYERRKAIKEERKLMKEAKKKEREEALRKYTEKKRENFKKLSQKTKWGQPVMRGRMEILLEKIQKSVANDAVK